jgi:excisionase family DNA binding protein
METVRRATARLMNVEEVMRDLCVGRSTVFGLLASGELRSVKIGRRRLVSESALIEYVDGLDAASRGAQAPR